MVTFNTPDMEAYTKLLTALVNEISITETQFENLVKSYGAVGKHLEDDPRLDGYSPLVFPQGSLRLGTIIQPVGKDDDLDVDLVIRLTGKSPYWSQADLKRIIGDRLKSHGVYKDMLYEEGRRCWTLLYRQNSYSKSERYHMDILPSVSEAGMTVFFEKSCHKHLALSRQSVLPYESPTPSLQITTQGRIFSHGIQATRMRMPTGLPTVVAQQG